MILQEHVDFKKFKNKDLSLVWFEYDKLFCDIAATGERARAPSQRSGNEIAIENEILEVDGEANEVEQHVEIGDSDDLEILDWLIMIQVLRPMKQVVWLKSLCFHL